MLIYEISRHLLINYDREHNIQSFSLLYNLDTRWLQSQCKSWFAFISLFTVTTSRNVNRAKIKQENPTQRTWRLMKRSQSNGKPALRSSYFTSAHQKLIHMMFYEIPDWYSPKLLRASKEKGKSEELLQPKETWLNKMS